MSCILGMAGEAWKPVPEFDGYIVSDHGRLVSLKRKKPVFLRYEIDRDGYFRTRLFREKKSIHVVVSRLVCVAFNGVPPSPLHVCCHKDNNKQNNNAFNLRWGTQKSNIADKLVHGTHQTGEKHPAAIITLEDAVAVKKALKSFPGTRGKLINAVRVTGVSYHVVADISSGKSWRFA